MASQTTMVRFLSDNMAVGGVGPSGTSYATGGALEQMLPVFSGEILSAYSRHLLFPGMVRTVAPKPGAAHFDFPLSWKIGSERHDAGDELLGLDSETGRRRIYLDDRPLVSHFAIDDIDELMGHFSLRNELASQVGIQLAEQTDADILRMLILASRTAKTAGTSFPGGGGADGTDGSAEFGVQVNSDYYAYVDSDIERVDESRTSAHYQAILTALKNIEIKWDKQNVPNIGRNVAVDVETWHGLRDLSADPSMNIISTTTTSGAFQHGSNATGFMGMDQPGVGYKDGPDFNVPLMYRGFKIWRTNLLSNSGDGICVDDSSARYRAGDYRGTTGVAWQSDAVGFIQKLGITTEQERDVRRGQDFMVAKTLYGGGGLRVQNAVELSAPDVS